jgi:hypothetical protein
VNWIIPFASCGACAALGWHARGPLASVWWRNRRTIAEARIVVLEGDLHASRATLATARNAYLARLKRCEGCATCNPEPCGFSDLPDYELGAPE